MQSVHLIHVILLIICSASISSAEQGLISIRAKEKELVDKLRPLVKGSLYKDWMHKDEYLVRFLRAKDYNLQDAQKMIERTAIWRRQNKIDTILTEDFSDVDGEFPYIFNGVDKKGRPIMIGKVGTGDVRKLVLSGKFRKYLRLLEAGLELGDAVIREMHLSGHENVTRYYFIVDMDGFNVRQHSCVQCTQNMPHLFTTYENYYPDRLHKFYTINAPGIFPATFDLLRPILSSRTMQRVKIFSHNSDEWKRVLMSEIPKGQLPIRYGGTKHLKMVPFSQLKDTNPYVKAVVEKAFNELNNAHSRN